MAISSGNVVVGGCGGSLVPGLSSICRTPPSSSLVWKTGSLKEISAAAGLKKASRALRRLRSSRGRQQDSLSVPQPRTESLSTSFPFCRATEWSEMTTEERKAILDFEGLSPDDITGGPNPSGEGDAAEEDSEQVGTDDVAQNWLEMTPRQMRGQVGSIAGVVTLFINLLSSPSAGDGSMIAGAGSAVLERVETEVEKLRTVKGTDGQSLFEVLRLVKLLRMDVQLIAAARTDSTLSERLVQAKAHCKKVLDILTVL